MTFSMTQTTKCLMLSCSPDTDELQEEDEGPKLSQREIEDAERAEKEAQQRKVRYQTVILGWQTIIGGGRMTLPP